MKIQNVPFNIVNWDVIDPVEYPGETGTSFWRTQEVGNLRVRMVEYSPGYLADHWCSRGHVLIVLVGELATELAGGAAHLMRAGMSFQVADDGEPHRVFSGIGAKVFIVD